MTCRDLFANVLDSGNGFAGAVVDGLAAGIDTREEARVRNCFGPREKVGRLICVEAASLLLIEKEDGAGGEVFPLCGCNCCCCVPSSQNCCRGAATFRARNLGVSLAIGEDKETEVVAQESIALAHPAVVVLAGRVGEPVAGKG